jgi:hypothetical protein
MRTTVKQKTCGVGHIFSKLPVLTAQIRAAERGLRSRLLGVRRPAV